MLRGQGRKKENIEIIKGRLTEMRKKKLKDLVAFKKPKLPTNWDYQESVNKVKQQLYKWKNLTLEMAQELWIAREILSVQERRTDLEKRK